MAPRASLATTGVRSLNTCVVCTVVCGVSRVKAAGVDVVIEFAGSKIDDAIVEWELELTRRHMKKL